MYKSSDCLLAVQAIQDVQLDRSLVSHTLIDIKELLAHLSQVSILCEPRKTNRVAQSLASHAYELTVTQTWFSHAPVFIQDTLAYDCNSC
jgi:hypothetical protein